MDMWSEITIVSLLVVSVFLELLMFLEMRKPNKTTEKLVEEAKSEDSPGGSKITESEAEKIAFSLLPEAVESQKKHEFEIGRKYDLKLWRRAIISRLENRLESEGGKLPEHVRAHVNRLIRE